LSTIASLATAGGTLVLAVATFASVRSANQAARSSERALQAGLRPVIMPTRLQDPPEKIGYADNHWIKVPGGHGHAEATEEAIYFAIPVRNVASGLAVLHGWEFHPRRESGDVVRPDPARFNRLTRDLYVAGHDQGFWQGVFREPTDPRFAEARDAIQERVPLTIDVLYGDHEGGQRTITRFGLTPIQDGDWLAVVSRHWNIDRADPR
jgi:hypothetical protein